MLVTNHATTTSDVVKAFFEAEAGAKTELPSLKLG